MLDEESGSENSSGPNRLKANSDSFDEEFDPPPNRSLTELIQSLEERGAKVTDISYMAEEKTMMYGYMHLMDLYQSECFVAGHLTFYTNERTLKYVADFLHKVSPRHIGKDLVKCIEANTPVIFIPLQIKTDDPTKGHQNMLIYRPFHKTVERFEPHHLEFSPLLNDLLKTLFEETLESKLGEYTPTYYPPPQLCPAHAVGLQEVDELSRFDVSLEGGGYCQIWSLFLIESILTNPEMDTADVIEECFRLSKSDPEYLRRMMRGYVEIISKGILQDSEFNIKLGKFSGKVPNITNQIQDAIDRAATYKKQKKNATRKISVSERRQRASPEGDRAKVFNTVKRLSPEMRFYLCDVFHFDGPCRRSTLMARVKDLTPAELANYLNEAETLQTEIWDVLTSLKEPVLQLMAKKLNAMDGLHVDIQKLHRNLIQIPKANAVIVKRQLERIRDKGAVN